MEILVASGPVQGGGVAPPPSIAERLTIGLIGEAAEAVQRIRARSGLKKVDVINRAVVVYEFLDAELRQGKQVVLRAEDGTEERIKILPF